MMHVRLLCTDRSRKQAQNDTIKATEHAAANDVTAPVEIAVSKAVVEVEVDFCVNAEETHDESDKGTVAQAVPNDATTDTDNDSNQEVGAVLATVTIETPQEAVEIREVLERGDRVGPTEFRSWL